jgi:hypothetical protein
MHPAAKADTPAAVVTQVVVIPAEDTPGVAVDAAKVALVAVVVDGVKAGPADRAVVQVDRAAASASISARRKSVSSVSRRWT